MAFITLLALAFVLLLLMPPTATSAQNLTTSLTLRSSPKLCKPVADCLPLLAKGEQCPILPVPRRAFLPQVAPGTFVLTKVRTGVWVYNDGAYLALLLRMGGRVAVVDFPESAGSDKPDGSMTRVTDALEEILNGDGPTRIDMVYSHAHYDHIGAATRFFNYVRKTFPRAKVLIWGSLEARKMIEVTTTGRAPLPTVVVRKRGRTLRLGNGLEIKMEIVGGHAGGDLLVYIPKFKSEASVLMVVDLVFPRWSPFSNFALSEDLRGYIGAHERILEFDFDVFVGGHLQIGSRRDVKANLQLTRDIVDGATLGIKTLTPEKLGAAGIGRTGDPSAPEFGNIWFAFIDTVRRLQEESCYQAVLKKWGCRVGGLDITLRSHCFTAVEYVLLDL